LGDVKQVYIRILEINRLTIKVLLSLRTKSEVQQTHDHALLGLAESFPLKFGTSQKNPSVEVEP
jgi:hypothetical protein